ncbi:MAG TPA: hypothetical protein VI911_10410 [Patescibacteria group bacterium]|nr:hypothetical protein [Patescibacteria group bacterium]
MPKLLDWELLQEDVRVVLEDVDGRAKISNGSGAVKGNGDITSITFMVECKYRSTTSFSINNATYHKIRREAELLGKIPLLATRIKTKETLVTMSLADFQQIMRNSNSNGRDLSPTSDLLHQGVSSL